MSNRPRTVIRRRDGRAISKTQIGPDGHRTTTDLLASATDLTALIANIDRASESLRKAADKAEAGIVSTTIQRRDDQDNVFYKTAEFVRSVLRELLSDPMYQTPQARIIQPPRTGKTILMGEIIGASGATALILAPTLSLVDQHRQTLGEQLPTVNIGVLTGEEKNPSPNGVTIATYDTLVSMHSKGTMPAWLKHVTFVFADEGHESMTKIRQTMIKEAFAPSCIRIAFTATPDYNKRRTLATHYPVLISEISLSEAYRLNLLAQFKVWAQVVDVDASKVRLVKGDYDRDEMARLMSSGPIFETCRQIRWEQEDNASRATLICCSSQQQAHDLRAYLVANRPDGAPRPEVILSDTPTDERRRLLRAFEAGRIDTLINVGVLLRGWDSKRCKLLIDLYLSTSLVRSKQKYFRPLTKDGSAEASIWLIVPKSLPRDPILPSIVFGTSVQETWVGELAVTASSENSGKKGTVTKPLRTRIKGVDAKSHTVLRGVSLPTLDPKSPEEVRAVLNSQLRVEQALPTYSQLCKIAFNHPLFGGWGSTLLKYCGIYSSAAYTAWIQRLYPEQAGTDLIGHSSQHETDRPCAEDARRLVDAVNAGLLVDHGAWHGVLGEDEPPLDPLEALILKREQAWVQAQVQKLHPKDQEILREAYLGDDPTADNLAELARRMDCTSHQAKMDMRSAMSTLREMMRRTQRLQEHQAWLTCLEARGLYLDLSTGMVHKYADGTKPKTDPEQAIKRNRVWIRNQAWARMFYEEFVRVRERLYNQWLEQEISLRSRCGWDTSSLTSWERTPEYVWLTSQNGWETCLMWLLDPPDISELADH